MFSTIDYVVFGLSLCISITIGIVFAIRDRRKQTTVNFFLGNRTLNALPLALSFVVTFQSAITMLGIPAESYAEGMQYSIFCVGLVANYCTASIVVVPIFYPLKVTTLYQYYKIRFASNYVRYVALAIGVSINVTSIGIVLYGAGLVMETISGLSMWPSVIIFSGTATLYTAIGGFKSVIWVDVFQAVVMVFGLFALLIQTNIEAGGPTITYQISKSRMNYFDFNPDPTVRQTFWSLLFGSFFYCFNNTLSQNCIQRINSAKSMKTSKLATIISGPFYSFSWILALFAGVSIFAYYSKKGCDPVASRQIPMVDQIVPYAIKEIFQQYPGLPGLFMAAIAASVLSTLSSFLHALSTITYVDIIKEHITTIGEVWGSRIARILVAVFGLISLGVVALMNNISGTLIKMTFTLLSVFAGPHAGMYFCSVFFRKSTTIGVISGAVFGFVMVGWISFGQIFEGSVNKQQILPLGPTHNCSMNINVNATRQVSVLPTSTNILSSTMSIRPSDKTEDNENSVLQWIYSISYLYFTFIGMTVTIVVSIVVSLLTQPKIQPHIPDNVTLSLSYLLSRSRTFSFTLPLEIKQKDMQTIQTPYSDACTH